MVSLFFILYIISFVVAFLTIMTALYVALFRFHAIKILPKPLKHHLIICYYLFVIMNSLLSIAAAVIYFTTEKEYIYVMTLIRLLMIYATQFVRNFLMVSVIERIIATIYLEKYNLSYKMSLFWTLLMSSLFVTLFVGGYFYLANFVYTQQFAFHTFIFAIFIYHLFIIAIFFVLYFLNKRMYKISAYRTSLRCRHQIYENNKVLSFLYIPILLYTFISPVGSVIYIFCLLNQLPPLPYCIFHISYNLPHVLIFFKLILKKHPKGAIINKNVLFPASTQTYFDQLQKQWN